MIENIAGWTLALAVLGGMILYNINDEQTIYISSLYVYDSSLPQVTGCGSDIDCELALDMAVVAMCR